MPWLAVPYPDEARRSRLNRLYGIQGILQLHLTTVECAECVFAAEPCMSHWNSGTMADRPAALGMWACYQAHSLVHHGSAAPRSFLLIHSCVCPEDCGWSLRVCSLSLSLWPQKNVRNACMKESTLPPYRIQTEAVYNGPPTSVDFSPHAQTGTHSQTLFAPGKYLFLIRLLIRQRDYNQKDDGNNDM